MEMEPKGEVGTRLTPSTIERSPLHLATGLADANPPCWHISAPFLPPVPSSLVSGLIRLGPQKGRLSVSQHKGETISPFYVGD